MRLSVFDQALGLADRVSAIAAAAAAIFLAAIAVMMLAEIFVRYVLGFSLLFTWEFSQYLMSAMFFWAAAYTLRTGGHIRIGLVLEMVPSNVRRALDIAATAVGLAVTAMIAAALVDLAWQSFVRGARSFTPVQTWLAVPQGLSALGACLLCLQMFVRVFCLLAGRATEIEVPETFEGGG